MITTDELNEHNSLELPVEDARIEGVREERTFRVVMSGRHHFGADGVRAKAREVTLRYRLYEPTGIWAFEDAKVEGPAVEKRAHPSRWFSSRDLDDGDPKGLHGHPKLHSAPGWLITLVHRMRPRAFAEITAVKEETDGQPAR